VIPGAGVGFRLRSTGTLLVVNGHDLGLITAGLDAITMITGFTVLAAVRPPRPAV
jgi:ABC-2 type transport system permease protein